MTLKSPDISQKRIAVFAGSFCPFTIGHADIVNRGLDIFDEIIICVGVNAQKESANEAASQRVAEISRLYASQPRVSVESWTGLTALYAQSKGATALLRGVRSVRDFEYERDLADANRHLTGIETVILFSNPEYAWISSSLVRELQAYGQDVSHLLPNTDNLL